MANKIYEESHIQAIADAIREKNGTSNSYLVSEMSDAILAIESDGSESVGTLVESGQCGDNVTWKLYDDGILRIQGVGATYNYTAPGDEPENTSPFFDLYESIKNIIIEDGITYIGNWLFFYLHFVDSIVIPDGVYIIGEGAFYQCEELSTLHIPHSVTEIKTEAFNNCLNLQNVIYSGSRSEWNNISIGYNNLYILNATIHCEGKDIALQEKTITENGEYTADDGYDGFSKVIVQVDSITDFELAQSMIKRTVTEITAEHLTGITLLGSYAFSGCKSLTSITIPDSVTIIDMYALYNCDGLTSITIPDSVTSIGSYAFAYCDGLTSITIPDSVTSIDNNAFYGCKSLTSITLSNSMKLISGYLCANCSNLSNVVLPNKLTSISGYAFVNCTNLTSIELPDNLSTIGVRAFQGTGLTSLLLGTKIRTISDYAFTGCNNLTDIYITSTVIPSLGTNGIPTGVTIHVPIGSGNAYKSATNWSNFADKIVEDIVV